jgi:cytochrome c biogenesis protein CcmG/thiol:disulfide interchange protein DsbE
VPETSRTRVLSRIVRAALLALLVCAAAPVDALDAGTKMPEIGLKDLGGAPVSVSSLAGKVVIVDFWATWCAPCREELPELQKFHKKYGSQGLVIVGVSVDKEAENIKGFVDKLGLSFPIVHDVGHQVTGKYSPPKMPSSYIVDRKGIVRYVHGGYRASDAAEFETQIKELLAK